MAPMRAGGIRFLVATDVAARGIDIENLSHVINYTFPESPEVYIHRTGRTGRAGRHGTAISLIGPDRGRVVLLHEAALQDQTRGALAAVGGGDPIAPRGRAHPVLRGALDGDPGAAGARWRGG